MADDAREARVRGLLARMDEGEALKREHEKDSLKRGLDFLHDFSQVVEREILPAFSFYRSIDSNSFRPASDKKTATLAITRAGQSKTLLFRADAGREQVAVNGVPQHRQDLTGITSTSYATIFLDLRDVSSEKVKSFVEDVLEDLARND
jgi:hypothetical protein